ncbi:MAG: type II toxin-antitoxin system Phd/YefM family antitoxin [Acidobacteria bacterium]|nr:type II toxin-antitoxin system Phd/YefM family antitoxin [Acidobacteriota bacterium]
MVTETNAVTFRQNLGEMINQVQYRHDSIVISKDGRPVAVLIDSALFERIRRMRERFDALASRLAAAFADVPADEGTREIEQAAAAVRAESKARHAGRPRR